MTSHSNARDTFTVRHNDMGPVGECDSKCGTFTSLSVVEWKKASAPAAGILHLCRECCMDAERYTATGY